MCARARAHAHIPSAHAEHTAVIPKCHLQQLCFGLFGSCFGAKKEGKKEEGKKDDGGKV